MKLNTIFNVYKKLYYSPNSVSSVYVWNLGENIKDGLALCVFIKNSVNLEKGVETGNWDSANIFSINFTGKNDRYGNEAIEATYKLTTSILLQMDSNHKKCGKVTMSGSLTRQV